MNRYGKKLWPVKENELTVVLQKFRAQMQRTQAAVARETWLDESYISRLFSGERTNPSRDTVILLSAFGLGLDLPDTEELLLVAGYRPLRPRENAG